jgi:hypothetical protein
MSKTSANYIASSEAIFRQYKLLAEKALEQVSHEEYFYTPDAESNSLYLIIKHLSGNMQSRWTNFLTTDGEKEWRNRDAEFEQHEQPDTVQIKQVWEIGWQCLFDALNGLKESNLKDIIYIRGEAHSVMEAINRQVAHYSYHVGQMVFLAKMIRQQQWKTLSIAKGQSEAYTKNINK